MAFPGCPNPLVDPASGSILGEVCHIKADKPGAARYDAAQNSKERHGFGNLILMCGVHHKIIDDNEQTYPVETLNQWKTSHEVRQREVPVDQNSAKRFVKHVVRNAIHHGSVVTSQNQTGGQAAHSITNINQYTTTPVVPPLPEIPNAPLHFVPRREELQALKDVVLGTKQPVAIVGLRGMGGIGKSVLAARLAEEEDIKEEFPHGIFWVVVGQTPNIESLKANLAAQLGQPGSSFRQALADKACLLILDDLWDADHAMAFRELGPKGRILLTTRDASLISVLDAAEYSLDRLSDEQG